MNAKDKKEWNRLYELANQFIERKPWLKMDNNHLISITFEGEEPAFISITGKTGIEKGFKLFFGEEGLNQLLSVLTIKPIGPSPEILIPRMNCLSMLIGMDFEVPEEQFETINKLKLQFAQDEWIFFESYEEGYIPYECSMEEVHILTKYLEKLIEAYDAFLKTKKKFPKGIGLYSFKETKGVFKGEFAELPFTEFSVPMEKASDLLIHTLKKSKKNSQIWEVQQFPVFNPVEDKAYKKPLFPTVVVIMNHKKNIVINQDLSTPETKDRIVLDLLANTIKELGIPKTIMLDNPFVDAKIHDICSSLGIKIEHTKLMCCEEFLMGMQDHMNGMTEEDEQFAHMMGELQRRGVDLAQMQKDMEQLSEKQFMKKYADEMACVLTSMLEEEAFFEDDDDYLFDEDDLPFGDDDGFLDDDLFGDDDDMDYEDDFEYFEFKNRKEKVSAINDFFGSGKMFGANFKQSEKVIDFDMIETTWNHLLNESSQSELREMAEKMGALVDSKMTKKALIGAIRLMYDKRHKNLYELLSMKELDFLKKAEKSAINLKGMTPIDCLTVTKNDLIHLLSLGLIDIYVAYECEEYVLYVSAIEEINWSHARL